MSLQTFFTLTCDTRQLLPGDLSHRPPHLSRAVSTQAVPDDVDALVGQAGLAHEAGQELAGVPADSARVLGGLEVVVEGGQRVPHDPNHVVVVVIQEFCSTLRINNQEAKSF